jgi:hypothetical protein
VRENVSFAEFDVAVDPRRFVRRDEVVDGARFDSRRLFLNAEVGLIPRVAVSSFGRHEAESGRFERGSVLGRASDEHWQASEDDARLDRLAVRAVLCFASERLRSKARHVVVERVVRLLHERAVDGRRRR